MRSRQQLLLPVNPMFIGGSLLTALFLNMLLGGNAPWKPDFLALVLFFWCIHQPLRIGIGWAFLLGLAMDVHQSSLLGQHAFSYVTLSFFASVVHRRLLWFSLVSQALQTAPLFFLAHALEVPIRFFSGGVFPGWTMFLAPLLQALLWPLANIILLTPQRRPPDRDQNRPL